MGIGAPSALGTLLVQRLDAVLGTTLSQQASIISGARPDAVRQPADAESTEAGRNDVLRHPRESVDRSTVRQDNARHAVDKTQARTQPRADQAPRHAADTSSTASAPTRLGSAARTILALLAEFPEQAPPIVAENPLSNPRAAAQQRAAGPQSMPHSAQDMAPALAKALAQALQGSGLFYESHLAELAFGRRTARSLATEPQAAGGTGAGSADAARTASGAAPAAGQPSTTAQRPPAAAQTVSGGPRTPSGTAQSSSGAAQAPSGAAGSGTAHATPGMPSHHAAGDLPPQMHLLVRQQLEVLGNQSFAWQGEAWPDAPMRWEIGRRDQSGRGGAGQSDSRHWATRLRIALPRLGEVAAHLTLAGSALTVRLSAPESANVMTLHSGTLAGRLARTGLTLEHLTVGTAPSGGDSGSSTDG